MKQQQYETMIAQIKALMEGEHDMIANMANLSAILYHSLPDINWAGFYLYKKDELILGPFQGKVACMHIPLGKGVCGTCAKTLTLQLIDDVHSFPGHIACDAASRSEIVLPIIKENTLLGVLDIDAPMLKRFDTTDAHYLSNVVELLVQSL